MVMQIWTEVFWATARGGLVGKFRQRVREIRCLHPEDRLYWYTYSSGDFNVTTATECFLDTLVTNYQT
jgi:hypothetical protein